MVESIISVSSASLQSLLTSMKSPNPKFPVMYFSAHPAAEIWLES